ncbi:MAG: hypothetical protein U0U69_16310 [Acidimicrobiia bacterium]
MASALRRSWALAAALTAALGMSACSSGAAPEASPVAAHANVDVVDGWRRGWEPAAASFWDQVGAWEKAEGTPSEPASGGAGAAETAAAPGIVAAANAWLQAIPAADLPGDVTALAAQLTDRLDAVRGTWKKIEACGGDSGCIVALVAGARLELLDLRSAQFDLRPR